MQTVIASKVLLHFKMSEGNSQCNIIIIYALFATRDAGDISSVIISH